MEYSIQQLSRLSGVTTRTLRWYDKIGLLKPSRVADSGYRWYGPAQVDRLADILYYRARGVALAQIRALLDDPSFDRAAAFRSHLAALEEERARIDKLICSVREMLRAEERSEHMSDEMKFQALKERLVRENEEQYGQEVREKYGDERANQAAAAMMGLTQGQYEEWQALGEEIRRRLSQAVRAGTDPASGEGEAIVDLHRRWLTITGTYYGKEHHRCLGELYLSDRRITGHYDQETPGCAQFLRDAILCWVK